VPLKRIMDFLGEIGLTVRRAALPEGTFLPGIQLEADGLVVDEARLAHPGDLLHEAGHLAVLTPAERRAVGESLNSGPGEEMAAIAWSYAACVHLGLDAAVIFHDQGYKGEGLALRENFVAGRYIGVPLLQWYGLTRERAYGAGDETQAVYPRMERWLRAEPAG
jgi:hypothetical protein